jgi:uncharacterized protein YkwD
VRGSSVRFIGVACVAASVASAAPSEGREASLPYASWTASSVPIADATLDPVEQDALARCGRGEQGLRNVARALLDRKLEGEALPELDGITREQRAAGEPHPWPRAWSVRVRSLESPGARPSTMTALESWLGAGAVNLRRCGVASGVAEDGSRVLVVVAVEAFADLAPLPTSARTGQWLTIEAHLRTPATGATVLVLDAGGAPRTVPSWIEGNVVRSRFATDRPGELDVQVVANLASGPRPVIDATVFVDEEPSRTVEDRPAPGELELAGDTSTDDDRLARMVTACRAALGLTPLPRDPRLDRVALEHAQQMARTHELAHDAGDGDPLERLHVVGLDPHLAGENVAHAATLSLAHRALWTSPSHRLNLLGRSYDRMGIGVARDAWGKVWVVETFTSAL